eukprot:6703161-Prymnesium_polylepis.1
MSSRSLRCAVIASCVAHSQVRLEQLARTPPLRVLQWWCAAGRRRFSASLSCTLLDGIARSHASLLQHRCATGREHLERGRHIVCSRRSANLLHLRSRSDHLVRRRAVCHGLRDARRPRAQDDPLQHAEECRQRAHANRSPNAPTSAHAE